MNNVDKEYFQKVDEFIVTDSKTVFGNYDQNQINYIISKLILSAKDSIKIVSRSFDPFLKENILNELKETSKRLKDNVRILVFNNNEKLIELKDSSIEYKIGKLKNKNDLISNFLIIDDKRYRLECPSHGDEKCVRTEICCNDKVKSNKLSLIFESIWSKI